MIIKSLLLFGLLINTISIAIGQNQIIIGDTTNMNYTIVSFPHGDPFVMDIDNNSSSDFVISSYYYVGSSGPSASVSVKPLNLNQELCGMATSPQIPIPLDSLYSLNYSGVWVGNVSGDFWLISDFYNPGGSHIQIGAWSSKTKYLGIILFDGIDTLLGWIKIEVGPYGSTYFKVLEYACQKEGLTDINESNKDTYKIYPNPSNSNIYINTGNSIKKTSLRVFDITGKFLKQVTIETKRTELNISDFQDGFYIIEITNDNMSFKYKFLKN